MCNLKFARIFMDPHTWCILQSEIQREILSVYPKKDVSSFDKD